MSKYVPEHLQLRPVIQLAPLVDIAFWALIFFMVIAVMSQMESEVNITVPPSSAATAVPVRSGKIVINITREGRFVVNQKELNGPGLEAMLKKVYRLFPNQQVVIRADSLAYHKFVIQALDACLHANISEVSFATVSEEGKP